MNKLYVHFSVCHDYKEQSYLVDHMRKASETWNKFIDSKE